MINILSYVGMELQSEACLWTLLGLLRTIFDATLFKVNANLKQVWQMRMPEELTRPVQRVLRTMISGVILVQCFTVYIYLASYIVLLYPVFLVPYFKHIKMLYKKKFPKNWFQCVFNIIWIYKEERPALVLPWLLLAAVRKLLCELLSLALGLGTCVLVGPARPPCIKFLIIKLVSITPAFYMWLLVFSYYHALKMTSAFKTFPAVLPSNECDYGLELAVRRRRTKSLQGEDQLRQKLIASLYGERNPSVHMFNRISNANIETIIQTSHDSFEDINVAFDVLGPLSVTSDRTISDIGSFEDWFGNEVTLPRDTDRILEQFGVMLLRIAAYLQKEEVDSVQTFHTSVQTKINNPDILKCTGVADVDTSTLSYIDGSNCKTMLSENVSNLFRPSAFEQELIKVKRSYKDTESQSNDAFVHNIESLDIISYEVTRRTKTTEISDHDKKLLNQNVLKESNINTQSAAACTCIKNVKNNNFNSKAINTHCRLNSQNKLLFTDKQPGSAESVTSDPDSVNSHDTRVILGKKKITKK